ncbi:MAG: response regulator transcription factor [Pseudobutyrivibrio sp.]|nr:response regulator transcription factor [Pseudobutyrivibrio sp.]
MYNILLANKNNNICNAIKFHLETKLDSDCIRVFITDNGMDLVRMSRNISSIMAVITDVNLFDASGITVASTIHKERPNIPILFVSEEVLEDDDVLSKIYTPEEKKYLYCKKDIWIRETAFIVGAVDYFTYPKNIVNTEFLTELVYRINNATKEKREVMIDRRIIIDSKEDYAEGHVILKNREKRVFVSGNEIILSDKEYKILYYFMINKNIILSRQQILEKIWGASYSKTPKVVDIYVNNLRKKLGYTGNYINTIYKIGYKFSVQ